MLKVAENPLFYRKSSFTKNIEAVKNARRMTTDTSVDYKIVVDQPALPFLKKQNDLL